MDRQEMNQESQPKTVLVAEDSPTQALHLQKLLETEGLNVILACNGREGLRIAQEVHPDIIVLDLEMPEMNGLEMCQQLKEDRATADIPVIMFTHHDEREAVVMGLQSGAIEYIPKDVFADAVLLETLRQMEVLVS